MLKTSRELTNETVKFIRKFQTGELKPVTTGVDHLDNCLMGGLLPGTVVGIVGRAGHGKSYELEKIQRHILSNQKDIIFCNCNWELSHFKILLRDITYKSKKSLKEVLYTPPNEHNDKVLKEICDEHRTDNVLYQNEPVTAEVFAKDIEEVVASNPDKIIVVAIDNLENILNTEGNQKLSMDALLYQVNRLKNIHPFISFIILNQMNQNYLLRMDDPRKQKPIESDIYGSDQLLKLCDVVVVKMMPWKLGIREKFMVFGKDMYEWLDEHKVRGDSGKTASFLTNGRVFYFYIKLREVENQKNIQDLFIEKIFDTDDSVETNEEHSPDFGEKGLF